MDCRYLHDEMKRKKKYQRRLGFDVSRHQSKLLIAGFLRQIQCAAAGQMDNQDHVRSESDEQLMESILNAMPASSVSIPRNVKHLCVRYYRVKSERNEKAYQYRYFGQNVRSYKRYFDQGVLNNLWDFLMEDIRPEYRTPLKCKWALSARNS